MPHISQAALLAQVEELIGRSEQTRTRVSWLLEWQTMTGLLIERTSYLLLMIEERLGRLHARRQRLLADTAGRHEKGTRHGDEMCRVEPVDYA